MTGCRHDMRCRTKDTVRYRCCVAAEAHQDQDEEDDDKEVEDEEDDEEEVGEGRREETVSEFSFGPSAGEVLVDVVSDVDPPSCC